jgi:hypothetical protein
MRKLLILCFALVVALAVPSVASAHRRDRNHDRIPDRWERAHHLSLKVNQANRDQDRDGLRNRQEFLADDNPRDADTDNDGVEDGEENSGRIVSFSGGVLVIDLFGSSDDVRGTVTNATEVECDGAEDAHTSDNGDDDHSGPGDGERGDEFGDREDENENEDEDEDACGAGDLTPGAVVREAELKTTSTGLAFEQIELAR